MAKGKRKAKRKKNEGATVGYEAQLWQMADALRGAMDAAEYEHVVLLRAARLITEEAGRYETGRKPGGKPGERRALA